jgi:transcriptional regulator with XRE-family HTH domain
LEIGERIKQVRKARNCTQQRFADELNLKRNTIANYEIGLTTPSDRTISDICRIFNVNEVWLHTGEGSMDVEMSRSDEIAAFIGDVLSSKPDFRQQLISVLARLSLDEWKLLEKMSQELVEEQKKSDSQ